MKSAVIGLIRIYQRINAALVAQQTPLVSFSGCRSWPTCSEWTVSAIESEGVFAGLWKGFIRVLHCHPFAKLQLP